jgi:hypothetical protein
MLRTHCPDYLNVTEKYPNDEYMQRWFGAGFKAAATFENLQRLDFDGVRGRLMSSSYAPKPGHPAHEPMLAALRDLFHRTAAAGRVDFMYDTRIFVGTL